VSVSPDDPRPPYQQVADDLREAITRGSLRPGEKLPSGRELARRYEVALMTIQKALAVLRTEGHVIPYQGRGVFVRSEAGSPPSAASSPEFTEIMSRIQELRGAMDQAVAQIDERLARLERAVGTPPPGGPATAGRASRRSR
jgi:DNA-binding GntR family transcriptional regulator